MWYNIVKLKKGEIQMERYYIVDNKGNVWGDFGDRKVAEMHLSNNYTKEQIQKEELEIIEG